MPELAAHFFNQHRIKSETFATGCLQIKLNMTWYWYWHQIKSLLLGCLQLLYPTHAYGANFCNDLSRTFYKLPNTFICVNNIQISLKMGDVAWPKTFLCGQCSQYPEVHFTPQSPNDVRYLWKEICVNK